MISKQHLRRNRQRELILSFLLKVFALSNIILLVFCNVMEGNLWII